mgnify:CR=1 FL=1
MRGCTGGWHRRAGAGNRAGDRCARAGRCRGWSAERGRARGAGPARASWACPRQSHPHRVPRFAFYQFVGEVWRQPTRAESFSVCFVVSCVAQERTLARPRRASVGANHTVRGDVAWVIGLAAWSVSYAGGGAVPARAHPHTRTPHLDPTSTTYKRVGAHSPPPPAAAATLPQHPSRPHPHKAPPPPVHTRRPHQTDRQTPSATCCCLPAMVLWMVLLLPAHWRLDMHTQARLSSCSTLLLLLLLSPPPPPPPPPLASSSSPPPPPPPRPPPHATYSEAANMTSRLMAALAAAMSWNSAVLPITRAAS